MRGQASPDTRCGVPALASHHRQSECQTVINPDSPLSQRRMQPARPMRAGRVVALCLLATACREATGTPPDGAYTQPPRVVAWVRALAVARNEVAVAGALLFHTIDSIVVAVDPESGRELWRVAFRPPPVGLSAFGNVVRVAESVRGTYDRVTFLDAASGQRLFTIDDVAEFSRRLVATTPTELIYLVSDAAVLTRDRSTGVTKMLRSIPPPPIVPTFDAAGYVIAGQSGPEVLLVRFMRGRTSHYTLRLAPDGTATYTTISTPPGDSLANQLAGAVLDPTGTRLYLTANSVSMALDARTGAALWTTRFAPQTNLHISTTRIARYITEGADPLVHIVYSTRSGISPSADLRELVVHLNSGDVLRDQQFAIDSRPEQPLYHCGADGIVQLLGGPGFTFTSSVTGKRASALAVDDGGANIDLGSRADPAFSWPSGWMVVNPTAGKRLIGFRCALPTP